MDEPSTPNGKNAPNSLWPEASGSEQGFGATGVFGTVKAPEPVKALVAEPEATHDQLANWKPKPAKPQQGRTPKTLAEPVVHKVVFGGGAADKSPELLDRMRQASAERAPSAEGSAKGSAGFTELLRTLGGDSPTPGTPAKTSPVPVAPVSAQDSGFTSLLRTLGAPEGAPIAGGKPIKIAPFFQAISEEPKSAPAVSSPGGFTELLHAAPVEQFDFGGPRTPSPGLGEPRFGVGQATGTPAPVENKPGEFTKLFSSFGGAGTSLPVQAPAENEVSYSSPGNAGSFTQMLSLEQQSAPPAPIYYEERKPSSGMLDYSRVPDPVAAPGASGNPFSFSPMPEAPPIQSSPPVVGGGITRLIQMLDEPSMTPGQRPEDAPPPVQKGAEPGIWTQTFASLGASNEPAPVSFTPMEWPSTQAPPSGSQTPFVREAPFPASLNSPVLSSPPAASSAPGPSEFTRILDASRLRELSMRGSGAAGNPVLAPSPQSFAPAPTAFPVPSFPPPMPVAPVLPQAPSYPMSYGPQAGGMHAPGGSLPQQPGMYAPAPPMPSVPPAPPLKPAEPPMGKLQQYIPLLLILVIVLLVVLIVTVIFLMKH